MIHNVSYNDKDIRKAINDHVGRPFGLRSRYRMKGIGSPRYTIVDASEAISEKLLHNNNMVNYCNIELRPGGIIVGFRALLETYAWSIPYYKLSVHSVGKQYILYSEKDFVKIENNHSDSTNQAFMRKLRSHQVEYLGDTFIDYP